jgi:hypothetical protein
MNLAGGNGGGSGGGGGMAILTTIVETHGDKNNDKVENGKDGHCIIEIRDNIEDNEKV